MTPLIAGLLPLFGDIFKRVIPDEAEAARLEREFRLQLFEHSSEVDKVTSEVVKAEINSEHWLAANWRPITMLTFVGLIVARWFGFSAPGLTSEEAIKLWSIVEFALGGYVVGRSAEKVVPSLADVIAGRRK